MKTLNTLTEREVAERLLALKRPMILCHIRPDADTVGCAVALVRIFERLGIGASIGCADPFPERLAFLTRDVEIREVADTDELITVDVASPSQLGKYSHLADRVLFSIDHHGTNLPFADNLTVADESSTGEVIYRIFLELCDIKGLSLDERIAYPIYAAISSDTGGFMFSSTTPETYIVAARLIESGIDFSDINHRLFHSKSLKQIKAEGLVAASFSTAANGKLAYAYITKADRDALLLDVDSFDTAIDVVRSVRGAEVALFVRENDDGSIKASMRSTGLDVASIAARHNGGGHLRAAGCSPRAAGAKEAALLLAEEITEELEK